VTADRSTECTNEVAMSTRDNQSSRAVFVSLCRGGAATVLLSMLVDRGANGGVSLPCNECSSRASFRKNRRHDRDYKTFPDHVLSNTNSTSCLLPSVRSMPRFIVEQTKRKQGGRSAAGTDTTTAESVFQTDAWGNLTRAHTPFKIRRAEKKIVQVCVREIERPVRTEWWSGERFDGGFVGLLRSVAALLSSG
jgi:hypothetical protein